MIKLHQYPPSWNLPSLSPFCIKVEAYLRMARLPYEVVVERNPRRGPKGKMPFIEDGGQKIADSSFIIDHLASAYGDRVHSPAPEARATTQAFQRLFEDSLYWVLLYSRWGDDAGFRACCREFTGLFPRGIGPMAMRILRRTLLRQAAIQGIGRHHRDEIYAIGRKDLEAISDYLGSKPFFTEPGPTALDATAYGMLSTILWADVESPLKAAAKHHGNLEAYCERFRKTYW